jgi:nitroreductase
MANDMTFAQLFTEARSYKFFSDKPVSEDQLRALYDVAKFAPSASNSCPMRITFVTSAEGKEKLLQASMPGNVEKIKSAPVTAIIAYDLAFFENYPRLAPHMENPPKEASLPDAAVEKLALRNSSLQAGFLMTAARGLGLDCGPMSGFKNAVVDELFYAGTTWRSNFLINLGHGDGEKLHGRAARLDFDEACQIV